MENLDRARLMLHYDPPPPPPPNLRTGIQGRLLRTTDAYMKCCVLIVCAYRRILRTESCLQQTNAHPISLCKIRSSSITHRRVLGTSIMAPPTSISDDALRNLGRLNNHGVVTDGLMVFYVVSSSFCNLFCFEICCFIR